MRNIAVVLLVTSLSFSCAKKGDDPQPLTAQESKTNTKVGNNGPFYTKLRFENGVSYPDWTLKAVFVGTDEVSGTKKDKYRVTLETSTAPRRMVVDTTCHVWWEGGEPKSDYFEVSKRCGDGSSASGCPEADRIWYVSLPKRNLWVPY